MTLDLFPSFTDAKYKYEKMVKSTMKSWRTAEAAGSDEASYPAESENKQTIRHHSVHGHH